MTSCPLQLSDLAPGHRGRGGTRRSTAAQPQQPSQLRRPQGPHHSGWVGQLPAAPCPCPCPTSALILHLPSCLLPSPLAKRIKEKASPNSPWSDWAMICLLEYWNWKLSAWGSQQRKQNCKEFLKRIWDLGKPKSQGSPSCEDAKWTWRRLWKVDSNKGRREQESHWNDQRNSQLGYEQCFTFSFSEPLLKYLNSLNRPNQP